MSRFNPSPYASLPLLDTAFLLPSPRTPELTMSTSTTPSSGLSIQTAASLPKSPADANCLPKTRSYGPQSFSPPTSAGTTSTGQISIPVLSYSQIKNKPHLPAGPKDFGCPRPQSREPRRKIPFPRQGDTTCPYTIPRRTSSHQAMHVHHNAAKVSKSASQPSGKVQSRSRSSSSASTRSSSSVSSLSSLYRSSPDTVQNAIMTQALIRPSASRTNTSSSIASTASNVSSCSRHTSTTINSEGSSIMTPCITDALPSEVYPLLCHNNSTATISSSSSSSTLSTPSLATTSTQLSTCKPYNNFAFSDDDPDWLAICEPLEIDMNMTMDTSLVAMAVDSSFPVADPASTINLSGRTHINPLRANPSAHSQSQPPLYVQTQFSQPRQTVPQPQLVKSATLSGVSQPSSALPTPTPTSTLSATSSVYSNSFVPIAQGGGGMLVNTSRLRGRVMRPWN